jgi:hypothetical protein
VWRFKTDHKLWRTSTGVQYRSSSETGMCWVYWAAFASTPPRGCRAQQITTASARPSRWGRFFGVESKKTCTERAGVPCREVWNKASNLAVWRRAVWSERDGFAKSASSRAGAVTLRLMRRCGRSALTQNSSLTSVLRDRGTKGSRRL